MKDCKEWMLAQPENDSNLKVVKCRVLLIEARLDNAETQSAKAVLDIAESATAIQEANPALFSLKARAQGFSTVAMVHRFVGDFPAADVQLRKALAVIGQTEYIPSSDDAVPRDMMLALTWTQLLSSAATLYLAWDKESIAERMATAGFRIRANLLGRDHISTIAATVKLSEIRMFELPSSFLSYQNADTLLPFSVSQTNLDSLEELLTSSAKLALQLYPETDLGSSFYLQLSDYQMVSNRPEKAVEYAQQAYDLRVSTAGALEPETCMSLSSFAFHKSRLFKIYFSSQWIL